MIYLGDAWPAAYRGQLFMNNIHGARLNVDQLAARGSGYEGDRSPDFLFAKDSWSQIINLQQGPDGQMYMIDWYDANACHHRAYDVGLTQDELREFLATARTFLTTVAGALK